jgi:spore maturation protein CgeB
MRFLVAHPGPGFSVHDVYAGWVEALRELGHTVVEFNLGDRLTFYDTVHIEVDGEYRKAVNGEKDVIGLVMLGLAAALYKTRPHVLLSVSSFFADPELLDHARRSGTRVVLLHTESPYEDERQLKLAPHADLNLINDPTNIDRFRALAPTLYSPHAYRPNVHRPGSTTNHRWDFTFVGTGYPSRVEFFEALTLDGLGVALAGNWMRLAANSPLRRHVVHNIDECFDNAEAVDLYRSAKTSLNLYRREAEADHLIRGATMGPREIEMAACGLFFLRDPRPEGDAVLSMLPTFTNAGEASDLIRWYSAHDSARERLAAAARDAVADRTFAAHAVQLLGLLEPSPAIA